MVISIILTPKTPSHLIGKESVPVRESPWQKNTEQSFVLPYHKFTLAFCLGLSKFLCDCPALWNDHDSSRNASLAMLLTHHFSNIDMFLTPTQLRQLKKILCISVPKLKSKSMQEVLSYIHQCLDPEDWPVGTLNVSGVEIHFWSTDEELFASHDGEIIFSEPTQRSFKITA